MNLLKTRQNDILAMAREQGEVLVDELASRFKISPQTIRKDLNILCDRRLLVRIHGGAVISTGVENLAYDERRHLAPAEKMEIGRRAASLIPDNCSLFINLGTTTEQVADGLKAHHGLMVITNNINVVNILRRSLGIELVVASGLVRRSDGGIVGVATVDFINQFKVDYAVIGVSAIDEDGALLDYDFREVRVAQAIIENSRHVILVADSMKMTRSAPIRIAHISQINTLITDSELPEQLQKICREHEVNVEIVS